MPFANDEFGENKQTATYTLFQAYIKFSHTFNTFIRFEKIRRGSLFGLLALLNKGRQGYGGIIIMCLLYLTNSEPRVGYSRNFVHLQIASDKRSEYWFMV
jgi:hypothetical protein